MVWYITPPFIMLDAKHVLTGKDDADAVGYTFVCHTLHVLKTRHLVGFWKLELNATEDVKVNLECRPRL
jgi:hypothetical protein